MKWAREPGCILGLRDRLPLTTKPLTAACFVGCTGRAPGVSPDLEGSILTTPPAFMPQADVTVLEECPRTIPVLPFKGIFANVGSLGSWIRLRVSKARPRGRGSCPAVPGGPQAVVLSPAFLELPFPCPAPVCRRVTLHPPTQTQAS